MASNEETAFSPLAFVEAKYRELRRDNPNLNSRDLQAMAGGLLRPVRYDVMQVQTLDRVDRRCLVWNVLGTQAGLAVILDGR